jgi:TRAP-type mannitol/chloroaromatic compound transport system permease small subunit
VSDRAKSWIEIGGTIFFLMPLSVLLVYVSIPYAADSWSIWEQSPDPGGIPRYFIKTAIPIAFVLVFMQGVSELIKQTAFLKGLIPFPHEEQEEGI